MVKAGPAHDVWVHRGEEVALRCEVTVDRGDRDAGLARHCGNGHVREAVGHHANGRVKDPGPRLLRLLRSQLAAIGTWRVIDDMFHPANI